MKSMKLMSLAAGALALAAGALAQDRNWDFTPYNFSFRLGIASPTDSTTRGGDDTWINLGIDYNLNTSILRRGDSFISLDYVARELEGQGGTIWPVMLNNRFYLDENVDNRTYFIAGIGAILMDIDDTEWVFGGRVGLGMELSRQLFVQGHYTVGEKANNLSPSHWGLQLGYRF